QRLERPPARTLASPAGLVRPARATRSTLAASAHAVSGLGLGDHAAADPGRHGHRLLRAVHAALSECPGAGGSGTRCCARSLVRPGLIPARAIPAPGRAALRGTPRG